jgi:hypothetical protein
VGFALTERVWREQSLLHVEPGVTLGGEVTWHHEWWEQVGPRRWLQRYEQITAAEAEAIYERLGLGRS